MREQFSDRLLSSFVVGFGLSHPTVVFSAGYQAFSIIEFLRVDALLEPLSKQVEVIFICLFVEFALPVCPLGFFDIGIHRVVGLDRWCHVRRRYAAFRCFILFGFRRGRG